ncbi:por secretion system C-terminal sorting domain [Bacteroidales bacterium 6E]|nr:por secretion system C-terminal sorting domain [Bacteroidales bacterium 6E]
MKTLRFILILLFVEIFSVNAQTTDPNRIITPSNFEYTSFYGDKYQMLLYEGELVNLLIPDTLIHDDTTLTKMVIAMDSVWQYYLDMTKVSPAPNGPWGSKGFCAFVGVTCGYGCGMIGACGIEVGWSDWKNFYDNVKYFNNYAILKVPYYEFGRNFYNGQIQSKLSVDPFHWPDANMGYLNAIYNLDLYLPDQYENEVGYKFDLVHRANEFILDTAVNSIGQVYENALYPFEHGNVNFKPYFNAGLIEKLATDYGEEFIMNFYNELYKLPNHNNNIVEAFSNLCIATGKALNKNMKPFFKDAYKMPLNSARVDEELVPLERLKIQFVSQDRIVHGFHSGDSVLVRVKAITGQNSDILYEVFMGEQGDETNKVLTTNKSTFYLKNRKNHTLYWVKASDDKNFAISEPIRYFYRGNLIEDNSFEYEPNTIYSRSSSSLEANTREGFLLSAVRSNETSMSGNYSLKFDHSFKSNCDGLHGRNFPNIDYAQSFTEPFKGKYRVSAYFKVVNQYEQCQNIFANAWIRCGVLREGFFRLGPTVNNVSNDFQYVYLDVDSRENTQNDAKNTFFVIGSDGISGKAYVDNIAVKAILEPEKIEILSINSSVADTITVYKNETDSIVIQYESASDIEEYKLQIFSEPDLSFMEYLLTSTISKQHLNDLDPGTYYLRAYGKNEFGNGEYSKIKVLNIKSSTTTSASNYHYKDGESFLVFPNPVNNGILNIYSSKTEELEVHVCSLEGKTLVQRFINDSSNQIDIGFLANGAYLVRIIQKNREISNKLIIKR